jgi:hypothetical protein
VGGRNRSSERWGGRSRMSSRMSYEQRGSEIGGDKNGNEDTHPPLSPYIASALLHNHAIHLSTCFVTTNPAEL